MHKTCFSTIIPEIFVECIHHTLGPVLLDQHFAVGGIEYVEPPELCHLQRCGFTAHVPRDRRHARGNVAHESAQVAAGVDAMYQRGVLHVTQKVRCYKCRISGCERLGQPACRVAHGVVQPFWDSQSVVLIDGIGHGWIGECYHVPNPVYETLYIALSLDGLAHVPLVLKTAVGLCRSHDV